MADADIRKDWEEFYLSGKVEDHMSSNMQLLSFSMKSLSKTVRKRDFVGVRSFALLRPHQRDKAFITITKSIVHSAMLPQKDFVRGEVDVSGWIIKSTGLNSCLITRVSFIDFKGKIPASVVNSLNHRLAITSVLNVKRIHERTKEKVKELIERKDLYLPMMARVLFPHQCIAPEECIELFQEQERGTMDYDFEAFDILAMNEGDIVTLVKRTANCKWWLGWHNKKKGWLNIDYVEVITPTTQGPSIQVANLIMVCVFFFFFKKNSFSIALP